MRTALVGRDSHLVAGGDWVPVATQQLAHGAGPYSRQKLVVFRRHHVRALYIRERCSTPSRYSAPERYLTTLLDDRGSRPKTA